jgi:NitT/TauT family transport system permease protein
MRAINLRPNGTWRLALALLPFLALLVAYVIGSHIRLADNPNDKLLPSFADMGETMYAYAFEADPRTGQYMLWSDTAASLTRLLIGLGISAVFALVVGILIGLLPIAGATFGPFVAVLSMVPPLALLPILFIVMGLGEASKITLIVVGTTLKLIRELRFASATSRASNSSRHRRSAPPRRRSPRALCCRRSCRGSSIPSAWRLVRPGYS